MPPHIPETKVVEVPEDKLQKWGDREWGEPSVVGPSVRPWTRRVSLVVP